MSLIGKLAGSVGLGAAGIMSGIVRQAANASGNDTPADLAGGIEDRSRNRIQDLWTSDDEKRSCIMRSRSTETDSARRRPAAPEKE